MASFRRLALIAVFLAACVMPLLQADEPAKVPGELWDVTTQMTMEGMPNLIPAQKSKVCSPKEWTEPPGGMDARQKCTNTSFAMTGNKATWKTHCEGPPEMTGEGEIIRESDTTYAGTIKLTSPDGVMTVKLNGKKIGDCEVKQK